MTCPACTPEPGKVIPVVKVFRALICFTCRQPLARSPYDNPTESPMTTHDIPALEAAYRDACVAYCDSHVPNMGFDLNKLNAVWGAKEALQRAKAASEDDGAKAILANFARDACESRYGEGQLFSTLGRVALEKLRAAGYRVTKEPRP